MLEGRPNVSLFLWKTSNYLQQRCSSGQFIQYQIKLSYYVSNVPFVTEINFKDRHPLINDAFHNNCQQSPSISFV